MARGGSCRGDLVEAGPGLWGLDADDGEGLGEEGRAEARWRGRGRSADEGQVVWESPEETKQPVTTRPKREAQIFSRSADQSRRVRPSLLPVLVSRLWTD